MIKKEENVAPPVIIFEKIVDKNKEARNNEISTEKIKDTNKDTNLNKCIEDNHEKTEYKDDDNLSNENLLGIQEYNLLKNLTLNPDLILGNNLYFFSPEEINKKLKKTLSKDFDNYPFMFKPLKEHLIEFTKKRQEKEYSKDLPFSEKFKRVFYFLFNPEEQNKDIEERAKKIAFLISHLNNLNIESNESNKSHYIGIYSLKNKKFDLKKTSETINSIRNCLDGFESFNFNDNNIKNLYEEMNKLQNMIFNSSQNDDKNELIININFLIIKVNKILIEIENSYQTKLLKNETQNILKKLRYQLNCLAIKYNLKSKKK